MMNTIHSLAAPELPLEYVVVGEHHRDPERLLLQGDDGRYYEFHLRSHEVRAVIPDDGWIVESILSPDLDLYVA
jgi:hypothetical protein